MSAPARRGRLASAAAVATALVLAMGVVARLGAPASLARLGTRACLFAASYGPDVLVRALAAVLGVDTAPSAPVVPTTTEPEGPIVVVTGSANPFAAYLAEVLRAEGLNAFATVDLDRLTPAALAGREVVVLGDLALTDASVATLTAWTEAGGTLIAMHPDHRLAPLLGLTPAPGTLDDAYLAVDTRASPGRGIVGDTLQFHGSADLWEPQADARVIATLFEDAATPTRFPAVTARAVGARGGIAIAFAYDLARSVVYTRQGSPAWAEEKAGVRAPRRAVDLFVADPTAAGGRGWLDVTKLAIPQADEQQRLLANVILERRPLPRFWYLPNGAAAAVVMTGDAHGDALVRRRFDRYRDASPPGCAIDDWECVRATAYLYVGDTFTARDAEEYTRLGFEVALHTDTKCRDWSPTSLAFVLGVQRWQFAAAFPDVPPPVTARTHCAAWSDWSTAAAIESADGVRLDANYYLYPAAWTGGRTGFFTGSGFPMRFAARDGGVIDAYQAATQITDESGMALPAACDALLDAATGPAGFYGVVTVNMHFDAVEHPGSDAIVASARARGVPVIAARQLLEWVDGRNASAFRAVTRRQDELDFTIAVGSGARHLRAMLPIITGGGSLSEVRRDGAPIAYTVRTVKGIAYAFFAAESGSYVTRYRRAVP